MTYLSRKKRLLKGMLTLFIILDSDTLDKAGNCDARLTLRCRILNYGTKMETLLYILLKAVQTHRSEFVRVCFGKQDRQF